MPRRKPGHFDFTAPEGLLIPSKFPFFKTFLPLRAFLLENFNNKNKYEEFNQNT
jgi:hypothetical protein